MQIPTHQTDDSPRSDPEPDTDPLSALWAPRGAPSELFACSSTAAATAATVGATSAAPAGAAGTMAESISALWAESHSATCWPEASSRPMKAVESADSCNQD